MAIDVGANEGELEPALEREGLLLILEEDDGLDRGLVGQLLVLSRVDLVDAIARRVEVWLQAQGDEAGG